MHPISNCARSSDSQPSRWQRRLTECVLCLGGLIAGATLVAFAIPTSRPLSAGASAGQSAPQVGLLDFTATWCGPCQQMSPIVEGLQRQGYPVYKVDVDQRPDLAKQFRITGMPTFVLVVNGQEVMRQTGATSESQLRRMLLQIPEYQKIAQQKARDSQPVQVASADPEFGPSPVNVDLGNARRELPRTVAAAEPPSKPKFGLPFFNRDKPAPEKPPFDLAEAAIRGQTPDASAPASSEPVVAKDPMQASTRLRVKDQTGVNYGSGTIIHSRIGRTLILTCGHIFRGMDAAGVVEVDVFGGNRQPQTFVGKVLHYDLDADIGVVAIPSHEVLPAIPLASLDQPVSQGDAVLSIGCSSGDLPTRESVSVTALNFYEGPDSLQCTGFPVQGRSGGGLFRGNELVGVCIAADPTDKRGVYTALAPVYDLLEKAGCGQVLPVGRPAPVPAIAKTTEALPAAPAPVETAVAPTTKFNDAFTAAATAASAMNAQAADDLHAAFDQHTDAEVICIVRPRDPKVPSRTVIIHQASPKLVGYLLDSVELPAAPVTPHEVLAQTGGLIPTTAQERVPQAAAVQLGAVQTETRLPRTLTEPIRPMSPRDR